jgi:type I restriction modification DNA specificity domain protein
MLNNNLEEQAMTLFKSWFIDYEPFDKQVPTTWKYGVLGDFVEIKRGGSPRPIQNFLSNRGLHWLKISDATCISSPFVNEIKEYIIEEGLKKTVFLKAGSLVLSNSATPGLPKILDIDTCIHDGWLYFPSSKFSNEYLYLYFKYIRNNLVALGNGSVFTNLKTDILKNYPTNLPTDDVLNKFDEIVKPIFSMILSKTRESKRLIEIRDTLLPKLMSGELDVSNIDF